MTAQKRVIYSGTPLAALAINAQVAIRVTSGSINQPTCEVTLSAST